MGAAVLGFEPAWARDQAQGHAGGGAHVAPVGGRRGGALRHVAVGLGRPRPSLRLGGRLDLGPTAGEGRIPRYRGGTLWVRRRVGGWQCGLFGGNPFAIDQFVLGDVERDAVPVVAVAGIGGEAEHPRQPSGRAREAADSTVEDDVDWIATTSSMYLLNESDLVHSSRVLLYPSSARHRFHVGARSRRQARDVAGHALSSET